MKRIFSILLVLCMVLSCMPIVASANENEEPQDGCFYFDFDEPDGEVYLDGGAYEDEKVERFVNYPFTVGQTYRITASAYKTEYEMFRYVIGSTSEYYDSQTDVLDFTPDALDSYRFKIWFDQNGYNFDNFEYDPDTEAYLEVSTYGNAYLDDYWCSDDYANWDVVEYRNRARFCTESEDFVFQFGLPDDVDLEGIVIGETIYTPDEQTGDFGLPENMEIDFDQFTFTISDLLPGDDVVFGFYFTGWDDQEGNEDFHQFQVNYDENDFDVSVTIGEDTFSTGDHNWINYPEVEGVSITVQVTKTNSEAFYKGLRILYRDDDHMAFAYVKDLTTFSFPDYSIQAIEVVNNDDPFADEICLNYNSEEGTAYLDSVAVDADRSYSLAGKTNVTVSFDHTPYDVFIYTDSEKMITEPMLNNAITFAVDHSEAYHVAVAWTEDEYNWATLYPDENTVHFWEIAAFGDGEITAVAKGDVNDQEATTAHLYNRVKVNAFGEGIFVYYSVGEDAELENIWIDGEDFFPEEGVFTIPGWVVDTENHVITMNGTGYSDYTNVNLNFTGAGGGEGDNDHQFRVCFDQNEYTVEATFGEDTFELNDGEWVDYPETFVPTSITVTKSRQDLPYKGMIVYMRDEQGWAPNYIRDSMTYNFPNYTIAQINLVNSDSVFPGEIRAFFGDAGKVYLDDTEIQTEQCYDISTKSTVKVSFDPDPYKVFIYTNEEELIEPEYVNHSYTFEVANTSGYNVDVCWTEDEFNWAMCYPNEDTVRFWELAAFGEGEITAVYRGDVNDPEAQTAAIGNRVKANAFGDTLIVEYDVNEGAELEGICIEGCDFYPEEGVFSIDGCTVDTTNKKLLLDGSKFGDYIHVDLNFTGAGGGEGDNDHQFHICFDQNEYTVEVTIGEGTFEANDNEWIDYPQEDGAAISITVTKSRDDLPYKGMIVYMRDEHGWAPNYVRNSLTYNFPNYSVAQINLVNSDCAFPGEIRAFFGDAGHVYLEDTEIQSDQCYDISAKSTVKVAFDPDPYKVFIYTNEEELIEPEYVNHSYTFEVGNTTGYNVDVCWTEDEYNWAMCRPNENTVRFWELAAYGEGEITAVYRGDVNDQEAQTAAIGNHIKANAFGDTLIVEYDVNEGAELEGICIEGCDFYPEEGVFSIDGCTVDTANQKLLLDGSKFGDYIHVDLNFTGAGGGEEPNNQYQVDFNEDRFKVSINDGGEFMVNRQQWYEYPGSDDPIVLTVEYLDNLPENEKVLRGLRAFYKDNEKERVEYIAFTGEGPYQYTFSTRDIFKVEVIDWDAVWPGQFCVHYDDQEMTISANNNNVNPGWFYTNQGNAPISLNISKKPYLIIVNTEFRQILFTENDFKNFNGTFVVDPADYDNLGLSIDIYTCVEEVLFDQLREDGEHFCYEYATDGNGSFVCNDNTAEEASYKQNTRCRVSDANPVVVNIAPKRGYFTFRVSENDREMNESEYANDQIVLDPNGDRQPRFFASFKMYGDANDDGGIDMKDVLAVRKYLIGNDIDTRCEKAVDANGDGKYDMKDVLAIRKKVANMITYLGPIA